jgi:predicted DNA-binding transcriptional regulator AlpA
MSIETEMPIITRVKDLQRMFSIHPNTARLWEHDGWFPKRRRLAPNMTGWLTQDIVEALRAHAERQEEEEEAGAGTR